MASPHQAALRDIEALAVTHDDIALGHAHVVDDDLGTVVQVALLLAISTMST